MGDPGPQLDRIREKLARVRARGVGTFGSGHHGFELGAPLSEDEVRAFEVARGVSLPAGYRAFITRVGHGGPGRFGGAGPYYGLYPLTEWGDFVGWIADGPPDDWLARPSPLRPGRNPLPEVDPDEVDDDDWPPPELLSRYQGVLSLGSRGCSFATGLVVSGEARGRVVYLDASHDEAPYVGRDADFLDWYERWLDELLAGYRGSWFGYGPAGGEAELLALLVASGDPALRLEALHNLQRIPALTGACWRALRPLLAAESADERAAAVEVFARGEPAHGPVLVALFEDESPRVRMAAYRAVAAVAVATHGDALWQRLWAETDADARETAFYALKARGALDAARLEALVGALLEDTDAALRAQAAEALASLRTRG